MAIDPLSIDEILDRQLRMQGQVRPGMQDPRLSPLSDQEAESVLSRLGGKLLSGVGYAGGLIDKYTGGRAARGLLGGKPHELLSLLPGSDALGVTREEDQVTGRDLTNQWGLTRPEDTGLLPTAAGIGADILTSPGTYLTFGASGAATDAGRLAAKLGVAPQTLSGRLAGIASLPAGKAQLAQQLGIDAADVVGKPLQGLVGLRLPFSQPFAVLGQGAAGQGVLDNARWLGSKLESLPGVRSVAPYVRNVADAAYRGGRALFDHRVNNALTAPGQAAGEMYTEGVRSGLNTARGVQAGGLRELQAGGALAEPEMIRRVAEAAQGAASPLSPAGRAANAVVGNQLGYLNRLDAEAQAMGMLPQQLGDEFAQYFPRHSTPPDIPGRGGFGGGGRQALPTNPSVLSGREEQLLNVPSGTEGLNALSVDPDISGVLNRYAPAGTVPAGTAPTSHLQRVDMVRERYLGIGPNELGMIRGAKQKLAAGQALTAEEASLLRRYDSAEELTRWAEGLPSRYVDAQRPVFDNHPLADFMETAAGKIKRNEALNAIHSLFAETAAPANLAGPGWERLDTALAKAGFTDPATAAQHLAGRLGAKVPAGSSALQMYVPPEVLADATRFVQGFQVPGAIQPLVSALDWITNLTKTFQTSIFPGFHTRNFTSGQFANWMLGSFDPRYGDKNPLGWVAPVLDAYRMLKGQAVEGASRIPLFAAMGLSDEEATRRLADLAYQYKAVGSGNLTRDSGGALAQAQKLGAAIPGVEPFPGYAATVRSSFTPGPGQTYADVLNPLNVAGVNASRDVTGYVRAGREIGSHVEDVNRLSGFIGLMRQGYAPEQASMMVRAAHVDYSALSDFERQVMRRLVPFYTYTRGIVPYAVDAVLQRPGGVAAQTALAAHEVRQNSQTFIPEYLSSGLAVPVGAEREGTQRFLTKFDTPVEAAFDLVKPSLPQALMGLAGMANPLIKGPLEYATGKQFFTGRDLPDLYAPEALSRVLGERGGQVAEQVLMNSPLSRLYTTAKQLADPRKLEAPSALAANLLTGARLSDVDMEKQRDLAAREYVSQALRGEPGIARFETLYARPGALASLSPQDLMLLRLSRSLEEKSKKKAEAARVGVPR